MNAEDAEDGVKGLSLNYMPEKRLALMRWCDHLDNVQADRRTRNVVSMTPKG